MAVLAGGRIVFQGDPREALNGAERWYRMDDDPDSDDPEDLAGRDRAPGPPIPDGTGPGATGHLPDMAPALRFGLR